MTNYIHSADRTDEFLDRFIDMCARIECDSFDMAGLMLSESNMTPTAHNPHGATGFIQFDVWDSSGLLIMPSGKHMRWQDVAAMGDDQLVEVEDFYSPHKGHLEGPGRLYAYAFIPVQAAKGTYGPGFVMCGIRPGDPYPSFYRANPSFDTAKKGYITADDMEAATLRQFNKPRGAEIQARLKERLGVE